MRAVRHIRGGHIDVNGRHVPAPLVPIAEWVDAEVDRLIEDGADELEAWDMAETAAEAIWELERQGGAP